MNVRLLVRVAATLSIILSTQTSYAQDDAPANDCATNLLMSESTPSNKAVFTCMQQMQERIRQFSVPTGIVVALSFHDDQEDPDRECKDLGRGWEEYEPARARMIVGTGLGVGEANGRQIPFTNRNQGATGGLEEVVLSEEELPTHAHNVGRLVTFNRGVNGSVIGHVVQNLGEERPTGTKGDGRPHDNMPPFIALHFCEFVGDR